MDKKILIIEDEYDVASTMELALEMEGYEVRLCYNGVEALEVLASEALPALIISDMMMPIMDGYEFTKQLREESRYDNIPLILASAARINESKISKKAYKSFIRKPFELDDFLNTVETTLNKK